MGLINVRLNLLDDTILFLSREAFRLACLGHRGKVSWFRYSLRKKLRSLF